MTAICYVIGPTNSGKSTFLHFAGVQPGVGLIEIGKMMRAKYPPDYFQGQCNPAHTAVEAWQMFEDKVDEYTAAGKTLLFADGQPRDVKQTYAVMRRVETRCFLHLYAPSDVRTARAIHRDQHDPAKLELSMQRLVSDDQQVYAVLSRLLAAGETVFTHDTSRPEFSLPQVFNHVLASLVPDAY